ncbi:MAG: hypothetical protein WCQ95_05515 [Bacteroidota bacterium]
MNRVVVLFVSLIVTVSLQAQSKKELKANNIKSITVWQADAKTDKADGYKESYEEYDKNGRTIVKIEYNKDGSIIRKETAKFDAYGNKIEETIYNTKENAKDNKNEKRTYKFNANNDKTEEVEYNAGVLVKKTIFSYNANGNKSTEMVYDASGKLTKKITYSYNAKNMKETRKTFNSSGTLESGKRYIYEYF